MEQEPLYVTESTDENTNKTSEYKDKEGRVVGKDASGRRTLYAYDDFGWLRCVIPPKASAGLSGSVDPFAGDLLFGYDYDERGRMIKKKVPGAGVMTMAYDTRDRLISSTDANTNVITTEYDALDRVLRTKQGATVLTETYYDGTNYPDGAHPLADPYGQTQKSGSYAGMVTGSKVARLDGGASLVTATYYDELGRVIQTVGDNHTGGVDRSATKLDYVGRVLESQLTTINGLTTIRVDTRTSYDVGSRVKAICQRVSDNQQSPLGSVGAYWEPVARHSYNGLGELTRKTLGCGIQNVDYTYQMRGWLTQINDPANLVTGTLPAEKHYFGMKLAYDAVGNITQWDYRTAQRQGDDTTPYAIQQNQPYSYGFSYDNLNRLKTGNLTQQGQAVFALNGLSYDDNGNIMTLNRTMGTSLDQLAYSYPANSNKLTAVVDNSGSAAFAKSSTYDYDGNGNLTKDSGKGITTPIIYNYLNLPNQVIHGGGTVNYTYSASGQKLKADFGSGKVYDYVAGLVYDQAGLEFIPTAEGRVLPPSRASTTITAGSSLTAANAFYRYEYQLKDHLGNLRVACRCGEKAVETSPSDTQTPLVVQENHYDPFGLDLTGLGVQPGATASRFTYNGKEEQQGLGWLDFNWRYYDPQIARFMSIDALATKYSYKTPYDYAENRPVTGIDLDGLEFFKTVDKNITTIGAKVVFINKSSANNERAEAIKRDMQTVFNQAISSANSSYKGKLIFDEKATLKVQMVQRSEGEMGGQRTNGVATFTNNKFVAGESQDRTTTAAAVTGIHELLHLGGLEGHPTDVIGNSGPAHMQDNPAADTKLNLVENNDGTFQYTSTPNTVSNIHSNIMIYGNMVIDGRSADSVRGGLENGRSLSPGQVNVILDNIRKGNVNGVFPAQKD